MSDAELTGYFLLALTALCLVGLSLPAFMRWGVETRGSRFLCFTRKGAERLAAQARAEGSRAEVVKLT